jgi:HlyD family secretion protein
MKTVRQQTGDAWLADESASQAPPVFDTRGQHDSQDRVLAAPDTAHRELPPLPPLPPLADAKPAGRPRWRLVSLVAAGVVASAAIASGSYLWLRGSQLEFETVRVERGHITARVTATGTLSAVTTVQVGTQVSGRVSELFVDFNSPVKKGQPLATLDPQLLQAAVDQAQANYVVAQGGLSKARAEAAHAARDLNRARSLWKQDLMTRAEYEADQANAAAAQGVLAAAQGTVGQAVAQLHQAKVNLGYTKILSPIDGVVVLRNVDLGQTVAASLQAPTLFTIAEDPRKMQVDTNVSEADVGKLTSGMKATFTVDAFPTEKFHGTVRQIRSAAQVVQNVVTYDAVIDFDNAALKLKPGMTANVTFVIAEKDDALKIPTAAARFRPPAAIAAAQAKPLLSDGDRVVWVLRKGRPQPVRVRTGLTEGAITEVTEGDIVPGDALVVDVAGAEGEGGSKKENKTSKLKVF